MTFGSLLNPVLNPNAGIQQLRSGASELGGRFPPYALAQSAVPFILAGGTAGGGTNQFTMGNNGAISTLPVLPTTYTGAWMYMPANAITGSNAAGWYWFVGSSTTAGTLYNNTYTSGDPRAPTVLVPFVSTGPGLGTQTTADIAAYTFLQPGGSMGPGGLVELWFLTLNSNSATTKNMNFRWGATSMWSRSRTTTTMDNPLTMFSNLGVQNRQFNDAQGNPGTGIASLGVFTSIDTSVDIQVSLALQIASATADYIILHRLRYNLQYGA